MSEEEKLAEILFKIFNGMYTSLDELKDYCEAGIELTVKNPEEKKKAKLMLSVAKEMIEKNKNLSN